jgi:hypothetical protein
MKLQILILELLRNQGHCMADFSCVELARANFVLTAVHKFKSHTSVSAPVSSSGDFTKQFLQHKAYSVI